MKIYMKVFKIVETKTIDTKVETWTEVNKPWKVHRSCKSTIATIYDEGRLIVNGGWTIVPYPA